MKSVLVSVLLIYVTACLALFALQRKFLYMPQPAAAVSGAVAIDFHSEGEQLSGWLVNPERSKALIYYGGNAERIENNITFFTTVLPDYAVYLIAYRGFGNSTGTPTEDHLYRDALSVFERVTERHSEVVLMGRSLGSAVAGYVAANRQVDKLILVTPFDSVVNVAKAIYWMFPVSLLIKDRFETVARVPNIRASTYIFIAGDDQVIPRARTEQLAAAFTDQLRGVMVIDGAGHNDISQFPDYVTGLRRILGQH